MVDNNKLDNVNFENGILLSQAENKTIFLSFCFEYKNFVEALNNNTLELSCPSSWMLVVMVSNI